MHVPQCLGQPFLIIFPTPIDADIVRASYHTQAVRHEFGLCFHLDKFHENFCLCRFLTDLREKGLEKPLNSVTQKTNWILLG